MLLIICVILGCLISLLVSIPVQASTEAVKVILDTDMATDCDDAGALAMLHALADEDECEILAVITDNKGKYSIGACDAINTYFGRGDIPLGAYKGTIVGTDETIGYRKIAQDTSTYGHNIQTSDSVPDALSVYRKILASQPDNSVVVIGIGHLNNISDLLQSEPDEYSSLNGKDLIAKKVKELSVMGGNYPSGKEHNFFARGAAPYTKYVIENWPSNVHIMFSGYEIGVGIRTGPCLKDISDNSPVKHAYQFMYDGINGRPSWDQTTVLYGVRGLRDYWHAQTGGGNSINEDGSNNWLNDIDKNQSYLIARMQESELASIISNLMMHQPSILKSAHKMDRSMTSKWWSK